MEFPFIEIWNILFSFEMTFETIAFFPPSFRVSCHAMGKYSNESEDKWLHCPCSSCQKDTSTINVFV